MKCFNALTVHRTFTLHVHKHNMLIAKKKTQQIYLLISKSLLAALIDKQLHMFFSIADLPLLSLYRSKKNEGNAVIIELEISKFEPRQNKTNKVRVRPAKTRISLGIRPVWSESSLSAWRNLGPLAIHWAHSKDSDQPGHPQRRLWSDWAHTHFVGFVMSRLIYWTRNYM